MNGISYLDSEMIILGLHLRVRAEQTTDPELYEQTAAQFESVGMPAAAARCRERAQHYRELREKEIEQCLTP